MAAEPASYGRRDALARLAGHFIRAEPVVVITGAGLSAASGVPVFRGEDPNAIWVQRVSPFNRQSGLDGLVMTELPTPLILTSLPAHPEWFLL